MSVNVSNRRKDELHATLQEYMRRKNLKASRQRDIVADVFFSSGGHLSAEDLLERTRAVDSKVSQATIYRTMKLLGECGLAQPRNFFDGRTLWELADDEEDHHDHLMCLACNIIIEFQDEQIERRQEEITESRGFDLKQHKMELYGEPQLDPHGKCRHCHKVPPAKQ